MASRFAWQNYARLAGVTLAACGSQDSRPARWVKDPIRTKTWRTPVGWNIVAGWNDKLDINEATTGDATATLTAGNYATGDAMAAELATQINAAATDNTYTVAYSASTNKFTITRATGSTTWALEWSTGANAATSCGLDLGWDTSADDTGLTTSATADNDVVQGRAYLGIDLGSALEVKRAALITTNLQATATVTIHRSATSVLDALQQAATATLTVSDADLILNDFTGETYRYWAFKISDVDNPNAFYEAGHVFLSSYLTPSREPMQTLADLRDELTDVRFSDHGSQYRDEKPTRRGWTLDYRALTGIDKTNIEAMLGHLRRGRTFLYTLDSSDLSGSTRYVFLSGNTDFDRQERATDLWDVRFRLSEAV